MRGWDLRYGIVLTSGILMALVALVSTQGRMAAKSPAHRIEPAMAPTETIPPKQHGHSPPSTPHRKHSKRQVPVYITYDNPNNTLSTYAARNIAGQELKCYRIAAHSTRGPKLEDLHNWLEDPARKLNRMPYIIDKPGCFQVSCIGDRGSLKLCNKRDHPSYMFYKANDIYEEVYALARKFRKWEANLRWLEIDPQGYPPEYWRFLVTDGNCDDRYAEEAERTMQDRVFSDRAGDGWAIQIDQPQSETPCNESNNFVAGDCRWTDPPTCSWPYEVEIPLW